jgi:hypothetical protein
VGQTVTVSAGQGILIGASGGVQASSSSGDAIRLNAGSGPFINNAGSTALSTTGTARWLVYSADPGNDTVGGLPAAFKQFAASGSITPVGAGNGLLYALAPVVTVGLQGPVQKVYDGTAQAVLGASNFLLSGVVTGDTVSVNLSNGTLAGQFGALEGGSARDAGVNKSVTVQGLSITVRDANSSIPVYGYALGNTNGSASANIGTITPASLSASLVSQTKTYDGNTSATLNAGSFMLTGFVSGEGATVNQTVGAFNSKNVGTATTVTANLASDHFAPSSNATLLSNYVLPTSASGAGTITQRPLSTWTGKVSGNWSDFANWDALPDDGRNVASVLIPAIDGLQVTYDLSALNLASLSNAARLRVVGTNLTVGALTNSGVLTVSSALDLSGVQVAGGGQLSIPGQLTLAGSSVDQALNNSGTVLASGSNTLASVVNSGAFTVTSGTTQVTAAFNQTGGTTALGGSAALGAGQGFAFNAGRVAGVGTLSGNVNINNAVLAPGLSPGAVNVEGNLTLGSGATLEIELAGSTTHDQVSVNGNLQLGGTLLLSSLDGFRPASTDRFNILSAKNSASGSFSTVSTTGTNLETLLLANLQMTSASGAATVPADTSTLANPAAKAEIVTEIVKQTQSVTSTNDPIVTSSLVTTSLGTSATRTLTPPAYAAPAPSPSPAPTPAPSPTASQDKAPSATSISPALSSASSFSSSAAPAVPTVRKDEVKSLELDPAPAPAPTATSSKATAEVSYATPDQGKAGDGKGRNASGTTSTGKDC